MTVGNLFSHPNSVQRQDFLVLQAAVKRTTPSSLVSRGSTDSISSWTSSSTAETTESDSVDSSSGRRSIFSDYWKASPLPSIPCQEDADGDDKPRSPLLEHYPARKEQSGSTPAHQQQQQVSASPPRRSIFGPRARSSSISTIYNSHQNKLDLDNFFSKHEHMKVVSSSLVQRRERSYSCSDASMAEKSKKGPLTSCLKRRSSDLPKKAMGERRPSSVTFDSQIEIVAFEPTRSFEEAPSCVNGSWTDLFEG